MSEPQLQYLSGDRDDIVYRLEHDAHFFIHFYMTDLLTSEVPEFHCGLIDKMKQLLGSTAYTRLCLAIPRGHAKTTLAKLFCVWCILFSKKRFIVYCSATTSMAEQQVEDVVDFLETPNSIALFGKPKYLVERRGQGFFEFDLMGKRVVIRAQGMGKQVRGLNINNRRPDLAICDDIEDNDDVKTKDRQKTVSTWFYSKFLKALANSKTPVIHIGNLLSAQSLLQTHLDDTNWMSVHLGVLLDTGQPLWPDLWPMEEIEKDFRDYVKKGLINEWYCEMMNSPLAGLNKLFDPDRAVYKPALEPGDIKYGFIAVDPAISEKEHADECAIGVHGWDGQHWRVADYISEQGMDPLDIFRAVIDYCFTWKISVVGVETNAFQKVLVFVFNYWCEMMGYEDIRFVELYNKNKKYERIRGWCAMLHNGDYALDTDEVRIIRQLVKYEPGSDKNEDDLIDMCSFGVQMIENYLQQIMEDIKPTKTVNQTSLTLAQVSAV